MNLIATQTAWMLLSFMLVNPTAANLPETTNVASQESAVASVDAVVETVPTVQDVLLDVCANHGYGEDCAKDLFGMMIQESRNDYNVVGDQGRALGYFQIWYRMHKVTRECATDLTCSADWSLTYMDAHNYAKYPAYAIQCHNSCGANNGYVRKVKNHAAAQWTTPMTILQPSDVQVALAK